MIVNEINISLDGRKNGIAIFLQNDQKMLKCKKDQQTVDKLFRSVKLAKVFLNVALKTVNPRDYSLLFVIDGKKFGFEESGFYNDHYIIYDRDIEDNIIKYVVSEGESDQVIDLGYLVPITSPSADDQKEKRQAYQKIILNYVKTTLRHMMLENKYFEKITKDKYGHICAELKLSSAKIHICTNAQLIKLNQLRKQNQIRCLPFEKNIDTYSTLYYYITKDVHECEGFGSAELAKEYLNALVDRISFMEEEFCLKPVEFKGDIRV